jgi:hypothetical protein
MDLELIRIQAQALAGTLPRCWQCWMNGGQGSSRSVCLFVYIAGQPVTPVLSIVFPVVSCAACAGFTNCVLSQTDRQTETERQSLRQRER